MTWTDAQLIALNTVRTVSLDLLYRLAADPSLLEPMTQQDAEEAADLEEALASAEAISRSEIDGARDAGARVLTWHHASYPRALGQLDLPPPVVYLRDRLGPDADRDHEATIVGLPPAVAIVGSRRTDAYGREAGRLFGREIAAAGVTVVSGLAAGVDAAGHRGALEATGDTIAVLGCGIDRVYPRQHKSLAADIVRTGAVISQFPLGTAPLARNFPVRNHLIAALSQIVLVVRATFRSGSLITARLALDLGRDVFAVPGSIFDPRSQGCHALLADGAGLAQHPQDLLDLIPGASQVNDGSGEPPKGVDPDLWRTLPPLGESVTVDDLAEKLERPVEDLLVELSKLELEGHIGREPGDRFGRRRR